MGKGRERRTPGSNGDPPPSTFASPLQYDQAFEDSPLVQMSTLTYETSQGTELASPPPVLECNVPQSWS